MRRRQVLACGWLFLIGAPRNKLARLCHSTAFAWLDARSVHPEFQLLVLLTMQRAPPAHWQLDSLTGMVTTEAYLPVSSRNGTVYKPVEHSLGIGKREIFKCSGHDCFLL